MQHIWVCDKIFWVNVQNLWALEYISLEFFFVKEAVCSCISTFVSFFVIPVYNRLIKYIKSTFLHMNIKQIITKKKLVQMSCTVYIVYTFHLYIMPILANSRQNEFFLCIFSNSLGFWRDLLGFGQNPQYPKISQPYPLSQVLHQPPE